MPIPANNEKTRDIYSVTRLNREVRAVLEGSFPMLWVQGEISNLARPASGHLYFSLKDAGSQVRCAMFKGRNRLLRFQPENGQEVLARAGISLYEGRGEFQLLIDHMEPAGEGALQRAYEELRQRLNQEGLFDSARKQPVPRFPGTIGVITSPSGAAIRDILHVLARRYPAARVVIYPVRVQGEGSVDDILQALSTAQRRHEADVLIVARGGGSLEDLWSFNDERVARAVYACPIPVISGVGHEIDFTITDLVADLRAPTPSAAAELATPHQLDLLDNLGRLNKKLGFTMRQYLSHRGTLLGQLAKRLPDPVRALQMLGQRIDDAGRDLYRSTRALIADRDSRLARLSARLGACNPAHSIRVDLDRNYHLAIRLRQVMRGSLQAHTALLEQHSRALHAVSPLATLDRGYAIVTLNDRIVHDAGQVKQGELIRARVAHGDIHSRVTHVEKK